MLEFETIVFVASMFLVIKSWGVWYRDIATVNDFRVAPVLVFLLLTTPLFCGALLLVCLFVLAAATVRGNVLYIAFYLVVGAAWLGGTTLLFPFLGISARDDVLERGNAAAGLAIAGALAGSCLAFVGANTGNGPGVEAVLFSCVLSSALFIGAWFVLERITHISEAITVDRDATAGIRLAGLFIGVGLLSGWSVAGDWVSAEATLRDFVFDAWPAILLALLAVAGEYLLAASVLGKGLRVKVGTSVAIAACYASVALFWIVVRGVHR